MDIKKALLNYLKIYDGRSKPAKVRTLQDIRNNFPKSEQSRMALYVYDALEELKSEGKIRIIPYSEMTALQKRAYEEDREAIYKIEG